MSKMENKNVCSVYSQLNLTPVNKNLSDTEQYFQWQDELNDWFKGLETILKDGKYYSETRVYPIAAEDFNAAFGTNLKY